jgi:ABC-type multidrug transport system fused ATPase/permease subunit
MGRTDFVLNGSKDEIKFIKVIASMVMPGLGQILSKKYKIGIVFLIGAIFSGLLPSTVFAIIPISQFILQPLEPLNVKTLPSLATIVMTLVNALFLFPSIIVWVIGIYHTIRINNPIEESQQFKVNVPLIIIGTVICAVGIAGVVYLFYLALIPETERPSLEVDVATLSLQNILNNPDAMKTLTDITSTNTTQLEEAIRLEILSESNQSFVGKSLQNILNNPDAMKTLTDITSTNTTQLEEAIRLEILSESNQSFVGNELLILIVTISIGIIGFILSILGVTLPHMLRKAKGSTELHNES